MKRILEICIPPINFFIKYNIDKLTIHIANINLISHQKLMFETYDMIYEAFKNRIKRD